MFGVLASPSPNQVPVGVMGSTNSIAPILINKKNPRRGKQATYEECVEKAKKKVHDFAAKGKKIDTRNLGTFVKVTAPVLVKILNELAQDPTLSPHITLPKA
jgi:hypothetical protein